MLLSVLSLLTSYLMLVFVHWRGLPSVIYWRMLQPSFLKIVCSNCWRNTSHTCCRPQSSLWANELICCSETPLRVSERPQEAPRLLYNIFFLNFYPDPWHESVSVSAEGHLLYTNFHSSSPWFVLPVFSCEVWIAFKELSPLSGSDQTDWQTRQAGRQSDRQAGWHTCTCSHTQKCTHSVVRTHTHTHREFQTMIQQRCLSSC